MSANLSSIAVILGEDDPVGSLSAVGCRGCGSGMARMLMWLRLFGGNQMPPDSPWLMKLARVLFWCCGSGNWMRAKFCPCTGAADAFAARSIHGGTLRDNSGRSSCRAYGVVDLKQAWDHLHNTHTQRLDSDMDIGYRHRILYIYIYREHSFGYR